jgi:hypothetical protein
MLKIYSTKLNGSSKYGFSSVQHSSHLLAIATDIEFETEI